jgi:hypothetical protein
MRITAIAALAAVLVIGCASPGASPSGPSSTKSPRPTDSGPPSAVPPPAPSEAPQVSPSAARIGVGTAVSAGADIELRAGPDPASDPTGTVQSGSTAWIATERLANGTTWYQVVPLDPAASWMPGWVASAEADASLSPINLGCDAIGVSASLLAGLSLGDRLACYAEPFTFAARIVDCNCDIDGGFVEPEWLGVSGVTGPDGRVTALLVDENRTAAPSDTREWLLLRLDPAATAPDPVPFGTLVEITGQFDHPAAASCVVPEGVEMHPADPVLECRTSFAVTAIKPLE